MSVWKTYHMTLWWRFCRAPLMMSHWWSLNLKRDCFQVMDFVWTFWKNEYKCIISPESFWEKAFLKAWWQYHKQASFSFLLDSHSGIHHFKSDTQNQEDVDSSSEDHTPSPSLLLISSKTSPPQSVRQGSVSSQDSRTESAGILQTNLNGFHRNIPTEGPVAAQSLTADSKTSVEATPPALPPKTRKSKVPDVPKELEYSDRGDSDMDEDTHSSSQEKQKTKKVESVSVVIWMNFDSALKVSYRDSSQHLFDMYFDVCFLRCYFSV